MSTTDKEKTSTRDQISNENTDRLVQDNPGNETPGEPKTNHDDQRPLRVRRSANGQERSDRFDRSERPERQNNYDRSYGDRSRAPRRYDNHDSHRDSRPDTRRYNRSDGQQDGRYDGRQGGRQDGRQEGRQDGRPNHREGGSRGRYNGRDGNRDNYRNRGADSQREVEHQPQNTQPETTGEHAAAVTNHQTEQTDENTQLGTNTREFVDLPETINDFEEMTFLSEDLFRGIHEYGFKYPSPIQSKTIHIMNNGCDLIAQSQSGSGKTGAFAIGALSRVNVRNHSPQVLIVANTRVLALQIHMVVQNLSKYMGVNVVACVGGHKGGPQTSVSIGNIKTAHVLVGTPGKINELLSKRVFDGERIKTLVMDETDVLLKDDFRPQMIDIISAMGKQTQICIYSATFTKETLTLTEKFLRDPYRVTVVNEQLSVKDINQYKIDVGYEDNKFGTLMDLFSRLTFNQMIIFVRSVRSAENLRNALMDRGIQAGLIHGKMESYDREGVLREFRLSYIKILITTDLMCRGIDIDDLRVVINYDMPDDKETYLHRVGRSGRYGGQGVAINLCTHNDLHKVNMIAREYHIDIQDMPDPEEVNTALIGMKPPTGKVSSAKNYN